MKTPNIVLLEDHHEALGHWRKMSFKNLALVHLDAHIDFAFFRVKPLKQVLGEAKSLEELKKKLAETLLFQEFGKDAEEQLNIGNYIYPAMRDGVVKSFYWIVPGSKHSISGQKKLERYLESIKKNDPFQGAKTNKSGHVLTTNLYKKRFIVGTLSGLSEIKEPLLLDIDVDYLLFDSANNASLTKHLGKRKPWIYPKEFVAALKSKFLKPRFTTIAYSVNGGYTPMEFKFFGDEIYLRLKHKNLGVGLESVLSLRNKGIASWFVYDYAGASASFKDAVACVKGINGMERGFRDRLLGHLYFWLYKSEWENGDRLSARFFYISATKKDQSLKVEDNNLGKLYIQKKDFKLALDEFKKILFCDPGDKYALCSVAEIFAVRKRYKEAIIKYRQALRIDLNGKKALLGLAALYVRIGAMSRGKNLLARLRQREPLNSQAALLSAQIDEKQGNLNKAIVAYKKAFLLGAGGSQAFISVFRILKKLKDNGRGHGGLFDFFRKRYGHYRSNFFKNQRRFLLKSRLLQLLHQEESLIKKIDVSLEK